MSGLRYPESYLSGLPAAAVYSLKNTQSPLPTLKKNDSVGH